jgi:hypothetical protein
MILAKDREPPRHSWSLTAPICSYLGSLAALVIDGGYIYRLNHAVIERDADAPPLTRVQCRLDLIGCHRFFAAFRFRVILAFTNHAGVYLPMPGFPTIASTHWPFTRITTVPVGISPYMPSTRNQYRHPS